MKKIPSERGRRGLHVVTSAATTNKAREDKFAYQIAAGTLKLKILQDELADEALAEIPDPDHVARLVKEIDLLHNWLMAHGVRVRG